MASYAFQEIEKKWQDYWEQNQTYRVENGSDKPKYYVLDMFPYPSGAGLHVGHPLGYIASDIVARYRRMKGYNVLHPMGFDSFGLPAEQYAIQTGQHPALTTRQNIATFTSQLRNLGFSYDWSREVRTSDPAFYRWTQWIFARLFEHYYDLDADRALPITTLTERLAQGGSAAVRAACDDDTPTFTAEQWRAFSETEQYALTLKYRLTYLADAVVNWCPALGTVLANDEVKDGVSERGGYPVEQKKMRQWMMRITAYADRLLAGLDTIDWPESLREQQRNWIGRSTGASVRFQIVDAHPDLPETTIEVFTTRVDTLYGVSFMVLAPEHPFVPLLTRPGQQADVQAYVEATKRRTELDRMMEARSVSGVFTGSYVQNPVSGDAVPIYLADYVLAGYGTGAVMGVPSGDQRDYLFARHFGLPIVPVLDAQQGLDTAADATKAGHYINSPLINGLAYAEAVPRLIETLESQGMGHGKVNYRLRDAVFSRQRYWGEPVPVFFRNGLPYLLPDDELPLGLPEVDKYLPTETGEPPLARAENWLHAGQYAYEHSTMPGWAGSSWYWYRYMDPHNQQAFAGQAAIDYWQDVDLYMGGSEHATGHLLYSRFWNKFLKDLGLVPQEEPFKKLVNQGMIQGRSNFVYRLKSSQGEGQTPVFVSSGLKDQYETTPLHVDVNLVEQDVLDLEGFRRWRPDLAAAEFVLEDGQYRCGWEVDKMSKRYFNVVNPDDVVARYGADTLRLYEMFLGPLTDAKPWNTNGISGTHNFLRKLWRLFYDEHTGSLLVTDEPATPDELRLLHRTIRKVGEDIEKLSFNTAVPAFMVLANELATLKSHKRAVLQDFVLMLSPFAPHLCEELWQVALGQPGSVTQQPFPAYDPALLVEQTVSYPIQINGKLRTTLSFPAEATTASIEQEVLANETVQKWLEGKPPRKLVVVPGRIVNVVV